jgi:hypothetical protein
VSLAGLLAAGCAGAADPAVSGGRRLPGTEDASCRGDEPLQISPDGRWLLYESAAGDPFQPVFVFYDLEVEQGRPTTLSPAAADLAAEGRGPVLPAVWGAEPGAVVFPGHGAAFAARPAAGDFELVPAPPAPRSPPVPRAAPAGFEVRHDGPRRLSLVAAGGDVLATHAAEDPSVDRLEAGPLRPSPDGAFLTYVLHRYRGSFAAPPTAFLVDLTPPHRPPRRLAAPVYGAPVWDRRGRLYACGRALDGSGTEFHVVRWTP